MLDKRTMTELEREERINRRIVELMNDDEFIEFELDGNSDYLINIINKYKPNTQRIGIAIMDFIRLQCEDRAEKDIDCEDEVS